MTTPEGFGSMDDGGFDGGFDEPASLGLRIGARLIDHILVGFAMSIVLVPILLGSVLDDVGVGTGTLPSGTSLSSIFASVVSLAVLLGYFVFLEINRGQTLGKIMLGIKVVGPTGDNPDMDQSLRRNLWLALSLIPVLGGLIQLGVAIYIMITINNSAIGQGWHDEFAGGTRVIRTR